MNLEGEKTRTGNAGFTLVELVVVIAILGILAGVAYVGYGGYIKYASRAADDEYIGAVNEAFAAACQESGVDHLKLTGGSAAVSFRDSANGVEETKLMSVGLPKPSKIKEKNENKRQSIKLAFENYFDSKKGNKEMILKYYSAEDIVFVGNGELFVAYGDSESASDAMSDAIWSQSGFSKNPGHVKDIVSALNNFMGKSNKLKLMIQNKSLNQILDIAEGQLKFSINKDEIEEYFGELGFDVNGTLTVEQLGTGFTAYLAHASTSMSPERRAELLEEIREKDVISYDAKDPSGQIREDYKQDEYEDPLLEIPMQLAALEGYYNSGQASAAFMKRFDSLREGYKDGSTGLEGLLYMQSSGVSIFKGLDGVTPDADELDRFRAYKNSAQFDTDMNAYFDVLGQAAGKAEAGMEDPDNPSAFLNSILDFLE